MAKKSSAPISPELLSALDHRLAEGAKALGVVISESQRASLLAYLSLLNKWNHAYNLTAIRDPELMLINHILDSLSIHSFIPEGARCLDVGTGPGLPGLVLAICCPTSEWTLLDSNGKKTRFVGQAISELGIPNAVVVQQRVENLPADLPFNIITARAFSDLTDIVNKTEQLLDDDGEILAMKGTFPKDELQNLSRHGKVHTIEVPFMDKQRTVVCITGSSRGKSHRDS